MAISIVNRTVFVTSSSSSPQSVTIPATTAGNTIVVATLTPGLSAAGGGKLEPSGVSLGGPVGRWGVGLNWLDGFHPGGIAGGQTSITWPSKFTGPSAAVIYELRPCK